jgi:hypothetical protein
MTFDPRNPKTWPLNLTLRQVAAIYGCNPDTIRHSLKPSSKAMPFQPAPHRRHPLQWRAVDVVRDLRLNDPIAAVLA